MYYLFYVAFAMKNVIENISFQVYNEHDLNLDIFFQRECLHLDSVMPIMATKRISVS